MQLDVLRVMLPLRLVPEAVNKSGCKAGFEVGIGLCSSPIPTITKLYGSVLTSILGPPSFVIVIYCSLKGEVAGGKYYCPGKSEISAP